MKIKLTKQTLDLDFNVKKDYPLYWREVDGKCVDRITMSPVKGHVSGSGDVEIDTGSLSVTSILKLMKAVEALNKINHKKEHEEYLKQAS